MNDVSRAVVSGNEDLRPEDILASNDERRTGAKFILLQRGSNSTSNKDPFLFPDGSWSQESYAGLEQLHGDFDVYGLVCPFLYDSGRYTNGIGNVVRIYLPTIKSHSPLDPYHLGGWSVGGVLAYEASKQLIQTGEEVHNLILIDAPCPTVLPPMSASLIEFSIPSACWTRCKAMVPDFPITKRRLVLDRFDATVKNLGAYDPARSLLSVGSSPHTTIIWAREGVCNGLSDPRLKENSSLATDATASWILDQAH